MSTTVYYIVMMYKVRYLACLVIFNIDAKVVACC